MPISNQEVIRDAYEVWIRHPITVLLLSNLEKHKKGFVNKITSESMSILTPDQSIRHYAINIKNTEAIISLIKNYSVFNDLVNKP